MSIKLSKIFRHPVKSVGSEELNEVELPLFGSLPGDRDFAITHATSEWRDEDARWMPCKNFLRVTNAPKLAAVTSKFDPDTQMFEAKHPELSPITVDLSAEEGRASLTEWVEPLTGVVKGPFKIVRGASLTDGDAQLPSLKSLASLRDLSAKMGVELDPRRFRGNLWIEGSDPWAELDWIGREVSLGSARARVEAPIERCRATMANPDTGERDADPLAGLAEHFDHRIFGVEIRVIEAGCVRLGDEMRVLPL